MKFIKQFNLFEISETWHPTGKEWYNYLLRDDITKYEVENIYELELTKQEEFKEREMDEIYDLFGKISKITKSNNQIGFWKLGVRLFHSTGIEANMKNSKGDNWGKNLPFNIKVSCDIKNPEGYTPPITKFSFTIQKYEDDWFVVRLMDNYKFYLCDQLDQLLDLLSKLFRVTSYYID